MHFFSDALLDREVSVTPTEIMHAVGEDGVSTDLVVDGDIHTYVSTASGTRLRVDVSWDGGVLAYDAVAFRSTLARAYRIAPPGEDADAGILLGFNGPMQSMYSAFDVDDGSRVRVELGAGGRLHEVYVLRSVLDLSGNADRPMRFRTVFRDPGRYAYRTENQTLVSYSGAGYGKSEFYIGWDYLKRNQVDRLRHLFLGPPIREPFFVYPDPDGRPGWVYRVYWESDFDPRPSASTLQAGWTLDVHLIEV